MDKNKCRICGAKLNDDLFSFVTGEKVCSICKIKFIGGLPTSEEAINATRERLGLKTGEFLKIDRSEEEKIILGRQG